MSWLLGQVGNWLAVLGGGLAVLIAAYLRGRSAGKAVERQKQEKADADFIERDRRSDAAHDGMSRAELELLLRNDKPEGG